ncbi:MAG: bifunctional oligoribonuclease/PAP phosphatase NrnA [Patescibacteria group bacterium]|nr:bifunctional oligoribonuclease/PAP phosphatase NrnA [Patescibacteria group bacterium]MDD5715519.1 bifunctional oligoribonuclease/PAP phosphatase NrnA [Patescibacteria group bacterium]
MVEFHQAFQKIRDEIKRAQSVLVVTHKNPDGDALGSLLAMGYFLGLENVAYQLFCVSPAPAHLRFLPNLDAISNDERIMTDKEHDLIIILDSGDLEYAGVAEHFRKLKGLPVVINIDHHPTNALYGHLNLVNPNASSTSEIIYHLIDFFRYPIAKHIATSLLTGILTDTGSFSNLGTTSSSLDVSSRLLASGARVREIISFTFRNKPIPQLQLWGRALSRLKENDETGIVTTVLTQDDFRELGIDEDSSEGISNFLNNVDHAKAIIVFREKSDGTVRASLRTTQPNVDVSKIAKHFGGGGHKKAAGFTIKGRLEETGTGWKVVPIK